MIRNTKNLSFIKYFVFWVIAGLFPLLAYTFVFDPWQLFHKPWFRETVFLQNSRFQDAGLINNYNFDSAILGTSIAQNFSIVEASKVFGSSFLNLSLEGAMYGERAIVLKRLLHKKKMNIVILSLDYLPEDDSLSRENSLKQDEFSFLYNGNRLDDFRIYMNWNLFRCWDITDSCYSLIPGKRVQSLESLYIWQDQEHYQDKRGVAGWCASSGERFVRGWMDQTIHVASGKKTGAFPVREVLDKKFKDNLYGTFDTYIESAIAEHPDVTFYLFFPPYSRLWYALLQQGFQSVFDLYSDYVTYVVTKMSMYKNVKVFAFEDEDFLDDLNHYSDALHYDPSINSKMLHWMAENKHSITSDNLEQYLQTIRKLADDYDFMSLADAFNSCLKKK